MQRTAQYHDEHIRLVDIWWDQLLDEIQIISHAQHQNGDNSATNGVALEAHFFDTADEFAGHLTQRRQHIITSIVDGIKHMTTAGTTSVAADEFQHRIRDLTARLKLAEMSVRKLQIERDEREPRIIDLQERLASSQRKVDRQKSITLARIESQARKMPLDMAIAPIKAESDSKDDVGIDHGLSGLSNEFQGSEKDEISASRERLLAELATLQSNVADLTEKNIELQNRLSCLTESDLKLATPYKELKSSNEHLRGQNELLQRLITEASQESSDLKAERTKFRDSVIGEYMNQYEELTNQLTKAEHDLARVRCARDELHSSLQIRKAQDDARAASAREISELADAQAVSSCCQQDIMGPLTLTDTHNRLRSRGSTLEDSKRHDGDTRSWGVRPSEQLCTRSIGTTREIAERE